MYNFAKLLLLFFFFLNNFAKFFVKLQDSESTEAVPFVKK